MRSAVAVVFILVLFTDVSSEQRSFKDLRYYRNLLLSVYRYKRLANKSGAQGFGQPCTTSGGLPGICSPAVTCLLNFPSISELENSGCPLDDGLGLCCPEKVSSRFLPQFGAQSITPLPRTAAFLADSVPIPIISRSVIRAASDSGNAIIQSRSTLESNLKSQGIVSPPRSASAFHQGFFGSSQRAVDLQRDGFAFVEASLKLANEFSLDPRQGSVGLNTISAQDTSLRCPEIPVCDQNMKYRTFDGSCNNLDNPIWGRSFTAFDRIIKPDYADGITSPRRASDGGPLPSARKVSSVVATSGDNPSNSFTHLMMQFAQFVDHDLTLLAITKATNDIRIRCCGPELDSNPDLRHPECFQIAIPRNDPFFSRFNEDCMEFVRSAAGPPNDCKLGPRQQINQLTAFLDASMVYGSTEEEAIELREFRDGLLKVTNFGNRKLLPLDKENVEECNRQRSDQFCFKAGDERVNEQIDLAAFHHIFLREHNRIVETLKGLNPRWNDERLYQEARKIIGAQFQHMVYNEFLPLLLGYQVMRIFNILPTSNGFSNTYDRSLNPSIFNGFATAAYRYGHTMVQDKFNVVGARGQVREAIPVSDTFNTPFRLFENGLLDGLLRGLTSQPAQSFDSFVTPELTTLLFKSPGERFGLDLVSLNIQRGRDHGLPSYNSYRAICGLPKINSFRELDNIMKPGSADKIRAAGYRNVDDIDVFIAGVSEKSFPGSILGPTFACLTGGQFARARHGDRFFYDNGGPNQVFTADQLAQIRKSSLARLLCDNGDNIRFMQPIPFLQSGVWNSRTSCSSSRIPKIDLSAWREAGSPTPTDPPPVYPPVREVDDKYKNIKWGG